MNEWILLVAHFRLQIFVQMFKDIHPKSLVGGDYLRRMDSQILFILSARAYTMTVKLNAEMYVWFFCIWDNNVNE